MKLKTILFLALHGAVGVPPPPPPGDGESGPPDWILDDNCPVNVQCSTSADCEYVTMQDIDPYWGLDRRLSELHGRKLQPGDIEDYIRMVCIHGLAPLAPMVNGPEPSGDFRRNLRFGNSGGGGCCFPYFGLGPIGPGPIGVPIGLP